MQRVQGFTLVELMITIAIVGILAAVAAPGFFEFVRGQRAVSQVNDFVASINLARNEAITRGVRVSACASSNPNATPPSCSGSGDWSQGWLVFVDNDGDGQFDGAPEELLRANNGTPGATLTADNGRDDIRFDPQGVALERSDFTLVPDGASSADENRVIEISATGRAQAGERFD